MRQLLDLYETVLTDNFTRVKTSRAETIPSTISRFGGEYDYDISNNAVHLTTTKKSFYEGIIHELVWFLRGETNIKYLVDNNVHFWDGNAFQAHIERRGRQAELPLYSEAWSKEKDAFIARVRDDAEFAEQEADLGPLYGAQWRRWKSEDRTEFDQVDQVLDFLTSQPDSRRMVISAWNAPEISKMALPPCHVLTQLYSVDGTLSSKMYQRSADLFFGVPFNVGGYELFTHTLASLTGLTAERFIHTLGDTHFYIDRGNFYQKNLPELKERVLKAERDPEKLIKINEWIQAEAPYHGKSIDDFDQVTAALTQLGRIPKGPAQVEIRPAKSLADITFDHFKIIGYEHQPAIRRKMVV